MSSKQVSSQKERITSIDILRGLAMFLILGTQIGGAPIFKTFVKLFGEDFAKSVDPIFSWTLPGMNLMNVAQSFFIFVVGLVIPFSLGRRQTHSIKGQTYRHVVKRSIILFILGMIAGGHLLDLKLANFYYYNNVLEYISICYLICSLIVLNTKERTQWFFTGGILLLVWAIWVLIPAPGWQGDRYSMDMNIGIYLDQLLLGAHGHPYQGGWSAVLNTISQIGVMMLGVLTGHVVFSNKDKVTKNKLILTYGLVMLITGYLWSFLFPSLRRYMTSSFVMETCGLAALLLALFFWLADLRGKDKWFFFFTVFGANSIAIYMMAHLFDFRLIGTVVVGGLCSHLPVAVGNFIQAVTAMVVMWLIMYYMYRKKTFIKI